MFVRLWLSLVVVEFNPLSPRSVREYGEAAAEIRGCLSSIVGRLESLITEIRGLAFFHKPSHHEDKCLSLSSLLIFQFSTMLLSSPPFALPVRTRERVCTVYIRVHAPTDFKAAPHFILHS